MKTQRAAVTGGCGFIGSNLAIALKTKGYKVTIVDNLVSARDDIDDFMKNNKDIEVIPACFASDMFLNRVKNGEFDYVFHNAAVPRVSYSVENPSLTTEINIAKTVKLMEACTGKIKRFIFASSSSVY